MHRDKYLEQANNLINGQRQEDYGTALENHKRIADLWAVYTGNEFTPVDAAMMMLLVKVARTMERPKDDSFVDICGYAALAGEMSSMDC
tara:strand:+ start:289 stop:555 length:267 start_codon:yes stop_codon:yes gene_type:complete